MMKKKLCLVLCLFFFVLLFVPLVSAVNIGNSGVGSAQPDSSWALFANVFEVNFTGTVMSFHVYLEGVGSYVSVGIYDNSTGNNLWNGTSVIAVDGWQVFNDVGINVTAGQFVRLAFHTGNSTDSYYHFAEASVRDLYYTTPPSQYDVWSVYSSIVRDMSIYIVVEDLNPTPSPSPSPVGGIGNLGGSLFGILLFVAFTCILAGMIILGLRIGGWVAVVLFVIVIILFIYIIPKIMVFYNGIG